jgi:hypothetical protein
MNYSKYTNPIEYPKKPTKPMLVANASAQEYRLHADKLDQYEKELEKYKADKAEYDKYANWKQQEFRLDAIEEVGLTGHPLAERAYDYAWDEGHYAGVSEVFSKLTRVAEMILGDSNYTPEKQANPMRDRLLLRLENIRKEQKYFLNSTIRWKNATYGDVHLSNVNFEELTDAELLDIYEMIIRRLYVQM